MQKATKDFLGLCFAFACSWLFMSIVAHYSVKGIANIFGTNTCFALFKITIYMMHIAYAKIACCLVRDHFFPQLNTHYVKLTLTLTRYDLYELIAIFSIMFALVIVF